MGENDDYFEQVRERAIAIAQQFENSFVCGDRIKEKGVTLFEPDELLQGSNQRSGEYFDVIELKGVLLNPSSAHKRIAEKPKQQCQRLRFSERADVGSYSIKALRKDALSTLERHQEAAAAMVVETKFLIHLSHSNIIKLHGMTVEGMSSLSRPGKEGFFTILERVDETLDQRIKRWAIDACNDSDTMSRRLEVGEDLSSALVYLSNRKIIFGALRPENVGFDANYGRLKLMNFGNAREESQLYFVSIEVEHQNMKSLPYIAPEILRKERVTRKSDVYSFGMILWTLLSLELPFEGVDQSDFIDHVIEGKVRPRIQDCWPSAACDLVRSCWEQNPKDRPNMMKVQEALEGALVGQFFADETVSARTTLTPPTSNETSAEFDEFTSICQRSLSASRGSTFSGSISDEDNSFSTARSKDSKRRPLTAPFASNSSSLNLMESLVDLAAHEKVDFDLSDRCQRSPIRMPLSKYKLEGSSNSNLATPLKPPFSRSKVEHFSKDKPESLPPPRAKMTLEQAERMFNASDSCIGMTPTHHFMDGDGGSMRNIGFQTRRSNFSPLTLGQPSTPVPSTPIRAAKALLNRMKSPIGAIPLTDEDDNDNHIESIRDGRNAIGLTPLSKRSTKRYTTVDA